MMQELEEALQTDYQYAVEAQIEDDAEAEAARNVGEMPTYFDLALHLQLADICWALEKWDEAKRWYRHNGRVLTERRAWLAEHGGPQAQTEGISDWEASTLVKAGELRLGRERVRKAIDHWRTQRSPALVLTQLGLHGAQAQLSDLGGYAASVIKARDQLPGGDDEVANRARRLLHYEPAQVNLLLGRWDDFGKEVATFSEGSMLVKSSEDLAFPEPLQNALVAASLGFQALISLQTGKIEPEPGRQTARNAFEEAMLYFFQFSGQWDHDIYFMRLNTRFADEFAAGRSPNPNPFADA